MKVLEKPGQIKPNKKDDIGENNNDEQRLNDTLSSQKMFDQMNDVDEVSVASGFNLMIQNADLVKNYQYKNSAEFQFANELNQWINENVLFWEFGNQPIKFFLPESQFGNNTQQTKIIPHQILYKQNSLFQSNLLLSNQDKQSKYNSSRGPGDEEDLLKSIKKSKVQLQQQKVYDDLNKQQLTDIWNSGTFTVQLIELFFIISIIKPSQPHNISLKNNQAMAFYIYFDAFLKEIKVLKINSIKLAMKMIFNNWLKQMKCVKLNILILQQQQFFKFILIIVTTFLFTHRQLTSGEPETWMVKPWVFYSKERSYRFLKDAFECAKFQFKQIKRSI